MAPRTPPKTAASSSATRPRSPPRPRSPSPPRYEARTASTVPAEPAAIEGCCPSRAASSAGDDGEGQPSAGAAAVSDEIDCGEGQPSAGAAAVSHDMDALHRTASKRAQVFLCHRVWLQYPLGESPQILDEIAIESLLSFQRAGCTQLVWSNVPREISNELAARDLKSVTCLPAAGCLIKEARLMHLLTRDTPIQHVKDILVMAAVARYGGIFSDFKVILKSPVSLAFICPDQTYIATEPCKQYGRQTNRCFRVSHLIPGSRTLAPHPVGSGASRALASPPVGSGAETGAGSDTRGKPRSSPSEGVALAQVWLGWGYAPIGAPLIAEFVDKSSEFWGARAARIQSGQTTAEANWGMSKLWMHNTQLLHDLVLKHSATLLEPLYFVALPPFLDSVSKMGSVAYN